MASCLHVFFTCAQTTSASTFLLVSFSSHDLACFLCSHASLDHFSASEELPLGNPFLKEQIDDRLNIMTRQLIGKMGVLLSVVDIEEAYNSVPPDKV